MNVRELRESLRGDDFEGQELDISLIIMHALKIDKTALLMGDREVSHDEKVLVEYYARRLKNGEPVQYIIGTCEFMSLLFCVGEGVLIPRSDTEVLVEAVTDRLEKDKSLSVMDLCCGSGCVGISLAHYMRNIEVSFCDISDKALEMTRVNADRLIPSAGYRLFKMDLLADFPNGEYDCIVSNPPYIRSDVIEGLDKKVKCFEPRLALDGGTDGFVFYRRISENSNLKSGGLLAFEIGFDQGADVAQIMADNLYYDIEIIKDIEGRDRVVLGYKT